MIADLMLDASAPIENCPRSNTVPTAHPHQVWPSIFGGLVPDQLLKTCESVADGHLAAVAQYHEMLDRRQLRTMAFARWREACVEQQHAVARMIGDEEDLLGEQPRIDGVEHRPNPIGPISVIGFLVVYSVGGAPKGPLQTIAIVDALALIPLVIVSWEAWKAAP